MKYYFILVSVSLLLASCGGGGSSSGGGTSANNDGSINSKPVSFTISPSGVMCDDPDNTSMSDASAVCAWICGVYEGRNPTGVFLFFNKNDGAWSLNRVSYANTGQKCA